MPNNTKKEECKHGFVECEFCDAISELGLDKNKEEVMYMQICSCGQKCPIHDQPEVTITTTSELKSVNFKEKTKEFSSPQSPLSEEKERIIDW